jgi:hypothetical protein
MRKHPGKALDNANVRRDLIGSQQRMSKNRVPLAVFASLPIGEYFSEASTSSANLRMRVLQGFHSSFYTVLARG